jgi:uncharacterized membrane protein YcaP (DUF421 family)
MASHAEAGRSSLALSSPFGVAGALVAAGLAVGAAAGAGSPMLPILIAIGVLSGLGGVLTA